MSYFGVTNSACIRFPRFVYFKLSLIREEAEEAKRHKDGIELPDAKKEKKTPTEEDGEDEMEEDDSSDDEKIEEEKTLDDIPPPTHEEMLQILVMNLRKYSPINFDGWKQKMVDIIELVKQLHRQVRKYKLARSSIEEMRQKGNARCCDITGPLNHSLLSFPKLQRGKGRRCPSILRQWLQAC